MLRLALCSIAVLLISVMVAASAVTSSGAGDALGQKSPELRRSMFAGGCFWCMESAFEALPGVLAVVSGYAGGKLPNPTYEEVSSGRSGHLEVVEVHWDPSQIRYQDLLEVYWANIDPTVRDRQFCDVGPQYRSAIFVANEEERSLAEASRAAIAADPRLAGKTVFTEIFDAAPFWAAEDYHQDFAKRNPVRYRWYRFTCGRDARLREIWGETGG